MFQEKNIERKKNNNILNYIIRRLLIFVFFSCISVIIFLIFFHSLSIHYAKINLVILKYLDSLNFLFISIFFSLLIIIIIRQLKLLLCVNELLHKLQTFHTMHKGVQENTVLCVCVFNFFLSNFYFSSERISEIVTREKKIKKK